MATIVQKYGGTSVEGRERLLAIAERVAALRRDGHEVVVVVSAPGKTTDALLEEARALCENPAQRELDMLMTAGERMSMSLLAIALNSIGCPAVSFTGSQVGIITDTKHTDARILEVRPHRVVSELAAGNVVVVGGFQGVSTAKDVTTLGRGGSDTTAVALAAALDAERCEILTDVDGIYTADPNRVACAKRVSEISYEDMCELARYGATVLKEEAVLFAERNAIRLHVRGSSSEAPGTIVLEEPAGPCPPVAGLTLLENVSLVTWRPLPGAHENDLASFTGRVKFVSLIGDTVVAALEGDAPGPDAVAALASGRIERVDLICAVGRDAGTAAVAGRALTAVRELGDVPVALVSEGRSMVLAVRPERSAAVLEALHEVFFA